MTAGDGRVKRLASEKSTEHIPDIVKGLKTAPQEGKERLAHLLDIIATQNRDNPMAIAKAGGIKLLVDMVSSGTDGGQLHAASTLATLAGSAKELQLQIVQAGAIGPLVSLLKQGSNKAQVFAAAAVASVSEEPSHKEMVTKAGAIPPLVRLLRSDVACDGQVHASDAIANLSYQNVKAQKAIHEAGAIPLLLKLLESGKAQISAANALSALMSPGPEPSNSPPDLTPANHETQEAIATGGAIAPLLSLLNGMNIVGQVHAASALSNIARGNTSTQNQIVSAGGIPTLLELLISRSAQAQAYGASALAQIARFNRENQDKSTHAGGLGLLVQLLVSSNGSASRLARKDHPHPILACAQLPFTMHACSPYAPAGVEVQAMAAFAVAELCRDNHANKTAAAELGTISLLIEQLKEGQRNADQVQAEAAGAIWVLSEEHESNKAAVEEKHGIAPTVLLLASNNIRAQNHAANALASLGKDSVQNQTQITTLLVGLLGTGNTHAKSNAAHTLWRIVNENPASQEKIAKAGPTSDLISLLKDGTVEAKEYALWSLSLSINESNQSVLLDDQGIKPLVAALHSTTIVTRQQAAAALAALAMDNTKAQVSIAQAGSIAPLIEIVKVQILDNEAAVAARENAAAALAQLAFVAENRDEVVEAGGIDPLVKLLHEGEPMSQRFAAAAIARLATNHTGNAATIAKAGAIPSLVNLLSGERGDQAQEEAAGALFELADDAGNRISITEAGGIGPLVTLLGSSNSNARRHAERVFVRLSIENANRVIIIEKLVNMLNAEGKSAQEQAAAALANLASDSAENRNSIVEAGGIIPLLQLLGDSSAKAKENAVAAISKLAQKSPDIQLAIQKAGGVPLLANVLIQSSANVKDLSAAQLCAIAASAVSSLAEGNKAIATLIAEAGAVVPLVGMLASPSPEMQGTAAGALAQLSHLSYDIQAAVARTGAIAPLCTLVREGTNEVKEQSAAALWAVTHENNANKATVAKLGGIEPLVTLLVSGATARSFDQAVGALGSLCFKHAENREVIAKLIFARLNSRVAMVQTPGGAVRTLSTISKLCKGSHPNQLAIAKAGCVPSVIMWLAGGIDSNVTQPNYEAQCEAANALLELATNNEPLQGLVVRSNGIQPLIELVNSNSLATQGAAVRTLWHLASSNESGTTIVEAGAMQPLCAMLTSENVEAQELAAIGISRLLKCNEKVSLTVAKVGGIVPLVKLLKDGSPTGQQQAVCAIAEVGAMPENRSLIADAGGIPRLAALLTSDVMGTSETAARALAHLARDGFETPDDGGALVDGIAEKQETELELAGRQRRRELLSVGAVKKLIAMMMSVSLSGAVVAKKMWDLVAKVVGVVVEEEDPKKKDAAKGAPVPAAGAAAAAEQASATSTKVRADIENVIGMQEQAAATLSDLAYGDTDMQDAIIAADGIQPFITLLRTGSKVSQEHAARAIWHLCAAPDNQGLIVDAGAVAELVALSRVGSAQAQELSAAVISDLAKGAILERERRQRERGTATPSPTTVPGQDIVSDPEQDGDKADGEGQVNPVTEGDRLSAIAEAGGVIPLVGLVTNGNQMGKERAASALLHLSVDVVNQLQIAKVGGIPPIVQLLDDGTEQAHEHAVSALARLAHDNPENQTQIAKKLVVSCRTPVKGLKGVQLTCSGS